MPCKMSFLKASAAIRMPLLKSSCYVNHKSIFCYILFEDIDDCESTPCMNAAACTDLVNGHNCTCVGGYEGFLCETGESNL